MIVWDEVQVYILDEEGRIPEGSGRYGKMLEKLRCVFPTVEDWPSFHDAQTPCIIFAHAGDVALSNDSLDGIAALLQGDDALLVLYSGGGEGGVSEKMQGTPIKTRDNENVCVVGRKVRQQNFLGVGEIKTVKKEVQRYDQSFLFEDYDCLRVSTHDYMAALSFLCKGYLAAHNDENLVGWSNVPLDLKKLAVKNKEKVRDSEEYWREGLGSSKEATLKEIRKEIGVEKIQEDSPILIIIRKIYESNSVEDLKIVRNTHSKTVKYLRS